ncbi:MAG: hypothetical protein ACXVZL_02335 [Gaiellaceae bacterium]
MSDTGQSRRSLLTRALVLVGGAIGIGAATGGAAEAVTVVPAAKSPGTLTFRGRGFVLQTPARKPGEQIQPGDQGTVVGELVDPRSGKSRGRFYGSRAAFDSGTSRHARADASVELHTFRLDDGTILGMGSALPGESLFSIVGGTGRYAGARGTYVATQQLRELGGDGTAHFVIDLSA